MINDWVTNNSSDFVITSIDGYGSLIGIENETYADLVHIDELKPIPLTEEILKMNGFEENLYYLDKLIDDYTSIHWTDQNPFKLKNEGYPRVSIFTKAIDIRYLPCTYVHELQHALRLCGLTELADNFKL